MFSLQSFSVSGSKLISSCKSSDESIQHGIITKKNTGKLKGTTVEGTLRRDSKIEVIGSRKWNKKEWGSTWGGRREVRTEENSNTKVV